MSENVSFSIRMDSVPEPELHDVGTLKKTIIIDCYLNKKVSYRKQIARQQSRRKNFGQNRGCGRPWKIFLSPRL